MSERKLRLPKLVDNKNDSEESLSSQFEHTLSLRGSNDDPLLSIKKEPLLSASPLLRPPAEPRRTPSLDEFDQVFGSFIQSSESVRNTYEQLQIAESQKTLVVLSPHSADHYFGRSWVSRNYLSTIVEKPERLLSSNIGIAAALSMYPSYYRIAMSTRKSSLLAPHVLRVHGKNWPKQLYQLCLDSESKLSQGEIEVPSDWNAGDIYLTSETINALEGVVGSIEYTIDKIFIADPYKLAFLSIRPPGHHCHPTVPSGFCLLNNVQIGIEYAFEKHGVTHAAILDIDLHHGDGSQDICWERAGFQSDFAEENQDEDEENPRNEYGKRFAKYPKVGYFSLHDINSFPTELEFATKENIRNASTCVMAHDLHIWNIHLLPWSVEEEFYSIYHSKYVTILNRANQFFNEARKEHEQQLEEYNYKLSNIKKNEEPPTKPRPYNPLIFISAGFDASEFENPQMQRHGVNVPTSFYSTFTKDAIKLANLHTDGRLVSFLEGGYSDGALVSGMFSHLLGLTQNKDVKWNDEWDKELMVKELCKGCKTKWTPIKKPANEVARWANEVIRLGRSMIPPHLTHRSQSPSKAAAKEPSPIPEVTRKTRSYYRQVNERESSRESRPEDAAVVSE